MSNFSKKLGELLKNKSISQVAKDIDIPKSTLSDWLNSKKGPNMSSMEKVRNLADYLGVTFEELIFGDSLNQESKTITTITFTDENRTYSVQIKKINN